MGVALRAFRDLVHAPDATMDLARGALMIAQIEHPDLEPDRHLGRLDALAARSGVARAAPGRRGLDRLREFLFGEEGFRGDAEAYYDPRNSCLNDVLDRRRGIPITLSVLTMEVGRRVGLDIVGIGLPGHFVVAARAGGGEVLLDPFGGGAVLTVEGAVALVSQALGRRVKLADEHFAPCSKLHIVERMLRNLKGIYTKRGEWERALAVIDRLLLVDEESPALLRDRGTALVKLGRFHLGAAEWERYLTRYPNAIDAASFKQELRRVRQGLAALN